MMKMSGELGTVVVGILFLSTTVKSNGYYGGDNAPAPSDPNSQSAPTGTGQDELWWLKNNPFQKPANHPGVERGDTSGDSKPNTGSYIQQTSGSYTNRPSGRPNQGQAQVSGGWGNPNQGVKPQENPDCLLRNKADCHSAVPATGAVNYQQPQPITGYPDGSNVVVPETAYRPPKFNDPYKPQPHGPTPPPLPYQSNPIPVSPALTVGVNPKPIESNYQQTQVSSGQYEPKPFVDYNSQYTSNQNSGQGIVPDAQPPYPGCPAAMLCVPESYCNAEGVSQGKPITLSPAEKLYRVALMACSFPTTGEVGVCCRDPNYKDPWPDMGAGQQHHPKDSSGAHGHNDGQYKPHQHNSGQYDNGQYNPVQQPTSGYVAPSNQQVHTTQDIPASPSKQGGGYTTGDGCRPSY